MFRPGVSFIIPFRVYMPEDFYTVKIDNKEVKIKPQALSPVVINSGSYETVMMLDTGASITLISLELAQKTGQEDLNKVSRRTFSTAKGSMSCPIVEREVVVAGLDKKQPVAVNLEDDSNLLGVDFFESRGYIIDNSSKCIYVWSK